eukprot:jgi/Chrzof1/3660/Cz13g04040.t1
MANTAIIRSTLGLCLFIAIAWPTCLALKPGEPEEAFIGWKGETYQPNVELTKGGQHSDAATHIKVKHNKTSSTTVSHRVTARAKAAAAPMQLTHNDTKEWIELISWKPRAFIYHNLLTNEEANHLKSLASISMKRSTVVSTADGSSVVDDYRTSYGTFLKRQQDVTVSAIEAKVARWVNIPAVHAEDMQVLRYGVGQEYKPHMDTLHAEDAGPRVATVLIYLNDVEEGGETAFPEGSEWAHASQQQRLGPVSKCAAGHVAFKPKKGDALLFFSIKPDGRTEDYHAMHTGCPVIKGVKWTATKWIHARPFRPESYAYKPEPFFDPGNCEDFEARCAEWEKAGECKKNPGYMVGNAGFGGRCRASCKVCEACTQGDRNCYNRNREAQGYLILDDEELNHQINN